MKKCEDFRHDYEHPEKKGRAHYVCPKCGKDITMELVFMNECEKDDK
jgi:predicted RNA-binding Zn-ribbon protein involved in translation (DUF1610 family)